MREGPPSAITTDVISLLTPPPPNRQFGKIPHPCPFNSPPLSPFFSFPLYFVCTPTSAFFHLVCFSLHYCLSLVFLSCLLPHFTVYSSFLSSFPPRISSSFRCHQTLTLPLMNLWLSWVPSSIVFHSSPFVPSSLYTVPASFAFIPPFPSFLFSSHQTLNLSPQKSLPTLSSFPLSSGTKGTERKLPFLSPCSPFLFCIYFSFLHVPLPLLSPFPSWILPLFVLTSVISMTQTKFRVAV